MRPQPTVCTQCLHARPFPETPVKAAARPQQGDNGEESIYGSVGAAVASSRRKRMATNASIPEFISLMNDHGDGDDGDSGGDGDDDDDYTSAEQLLKDLMPATTKVNDVEDIYDTIVRSKTRGSSVSTPAAPQEPGKRGQIMNELRETERGYLDGLRTIETSYYSLMRQPHSMKNMLLTENDLEVCRSQPPSLGLPAVGPQIASAPT